MATNRKIGNSFETEFCELLFQHGFWCHNMAQNAAGQGSYRGERNQGIYRQSSAHLHESCRHEGA